MLLGAGVLACGGDDATRPAAGTQPDTTAIALTDMGGRSYRGFDGGLYPGGNDLPPDHAAVGVARARSVLPLDVNGNAAPGGRYVLLSIGMSNTTQEFCSASAAPPCSAWSFMGRAAADASVNHTTLAIVNGAAGGQDATKWEAPTSPNYDRIRDTRLTPLGLSEKQVQAAWVKVANAAPGASLPAANADAYTLEASIGRIVRALKARYPNLRQVFLSSRVYGGYATTTLNPEPYAYESGFAVKWIVQAQIDQARQGGAVVDARAGDLGANLAPWLAWGPYLWADGLHARSDGLVWERQDFESDGTHPSAAGESKVGALLLAFFKESPFTRCWFLAGGTC